MNWLKRFSILGTTAIASLAISQSASARFVVFVLGNDAATLQKVRTVVPTAFATKINDQPATQVGTFNSEVSADRLVSTLNNSGLSPQKYFQSSGGKESNVQLPFTDNQTTSSIPTSVSTSPNPQQILIQQSSTPQTISFQTESQPQNLLPSNGILPSNGSFIVANNGDNFSTAQIQTTTNTLSAEQQLPQQTVNPNFRYIAAVPAKVNNQFLLSQVRQYIPNAFFINSGRGTYINAGAYQNRDSAESVSRYLRSQGIDSRVLYF